MAVPVAGRPGVSAHGLRRKIPPYVKGIVRRQATYLLPNRETREYQAWIAQRMNVRRALYTDPLEQGLLSILTPVWEKSPVRYLRTLANALISQNRKGACEWVVLNNGSSNKRVLSYLEELSGYGWIKVHHVKVNLGITGGLRYCLEHAAGRYVLPVDADDYLYTDALKVITSYVRRTGYPPLLYTDEDKVIGTRFYQPYFKPDWDPVLFLNSAYIAHLGIVDREKALELGAYTDLRTEGSPDWDLFIRFMIAGYTPTHVPEIVYSWRSHSRSTADDAASKPYIHASQKAVLRRFLDAQPDPAKFKVEQSPLLEGGAHWHFTRQHRDLKPPLVCVVLDHTPAASERSASSKGSAKIRNVRIGLQSDPSELLPLAREMADRDGFIQFVGADVEVDNPQWPGEALGLFELHPDTAMIGGRIRNRQGIITDAGHYFGFGGACGCPDRGRSSSDSGYFMQMWKQRSVSAVSTQFAVVCAKFLLEFLGEHRHPASLAFLGAWAGAHALRVGRRVVYSPFVSGISDVDWETLVTGSERSLFANANRDIIPDRRFYSPHLSLDEPFRLSTAAVMRQSASS